MEYFWYIIASIGAGVGTGLAGLSTATVIVPILIVLCPSFGIEGGVYQATAIALAADVLGSAFTAYIYAKNKNIDLKRGSIVLVCVIIMSIIGSIIAALAGNIVLGTTTLFLTLLVGIRFLVKPDSTERDIYKVGAKFSKFDIIGSLFFGISIGFGIGFIGSGGGMTMLLVFTILLKMERKKAVGTSTFIMTFTALIAAVSHMIINPSIILEKWNVLLTCIITTTIASALSAKFANKVSDKVVGLTTGAVLTSLGIFLLFLHYRMYI